MCISLDDPNVEVTYKNNYGVKPKFARERRSWEGNVNSDDEWKRMILDLNLCFETLTFRHTNWLLINVVSSSKWKKSLTEVLNLIFSALIKSIHIT